MAAPSARDQIRSALLVSCASARIPFKRASSVRDARDSNIKYRRGDQRAQHATYTVSGGGGSSSAAGSTGTTRASAAPGIG